MMAPAFAESQAAGTGAASIYIRCKKQTAARRQGLVVTTVEPALLPASNLLQPGGAHNDSSRNSLVPTEKILAVAIAPPCLKCFHALRHSTDSMPHTAAPSLARSMSSWLGAGEQAP